MKKLALVLVLVLAFTLPVLANPFVDVPLNHWAYDAVQDLAAKGVIIGYPDGTFGGTRTLTRYEFAEATARALAYVESMGFASAEDVEVLEKLSIEFADELANLGVKVSDLEAALGAQSEAIAALEETVAKHEKFFEPVTITGEWSADYSYTVIGDDATPTGTAELSDSAEITLSAEINPETTVALTMEVDDVLGGAPTVTFSGYELKYNGDWSLLVSDEVEPATIGLGLIYEEEEFPGVWAQWNWGDEEDDEDLGTWTTFMDVDDFYILNVAFNLGDEDDIPIGVTASYDQAAENVLVAGADVAFDLTAEDDENQVGLALEGGVLTDFAFAKLAFGAAAELSATLGDEDDIDASVKAWYTQPGFAPTNSDFNADELGVEVGVGFMLTNEDDEDIQIEAEPYWGYVMDSAFAAAQDHYVGIDLTFTNFDEEHPEAEGTLNAEYSILNGDISLEAEILNLVLGNEDEEGLSELVFNIYGAYNMDVEPDYTAVANVIYSFEDEPMDLIVEGRLDSDSAAALYSVEAQLVYAVAENTELKVGIEMNDWEDDINDWDEMNILDTTTKIYSGVEVSF